MLQTAASKNRTNAERRSTDKDPFNKYKARNATSAALEDAHEAWDRAHKGGDKREKNRSTKPIAERHYMQKTVVSDHHHDEKQLSRPEREKKW